MDNSVQELLDILYNMIQDAWGLPLGNERCVVERNKVLDILDEVKAKLPAELNEAKRLVAARSEFVANAKREAESMRKVAEERARQLVDECGRGKAMALLESKTRDLPSFEARRVKR